MTDTINALEALIKHLENDIEHLECTYENAKQPDKRSIDYEFGGLDLTLGDLKTIRAALQSALDAQWLSIETVPNVSQTGAECKSCGGDGIERCDNPDHGLLNAISFRGANESACPCCGHDEFYRMKHWDHADKKYVWNKCPDCSALTTPNPQPVSAALEALNRITSYATDNVPFQGTEWNHIEKDSRSIKQALAQVGGQKDGN
jgi:predicted RNA-binding Zn-ribbon protein involved in translation (DUF1610 family)